MTLQFERSVQRLTLPQARRIALAAQGFDRARPAGPVTARQVAAVIRRLGLLQLDFVKTVTPAHYQVLFSRLGHYDPAVLDGLVHPRRGRTQFTEQWAHEASILPVETWALLKPRREGFTVHRWRGFDWLTDRHGEYFAQVLEEVRGRGPLSADDLPDPPTGDRKLTGSWFGTVPRAVLESLFSQGKLAVTGRRTSMARVFDLAERVIPAEHFARETDPAEAERELLRQAARGHGVGTAADLADYFRMPMSVARPRLAELVAAGELLVASVEGWRETAYLHPEARRPRRIGAATLLSPFDPVVWFRPRVARLFEFDYRVEIFVPEPKRKWGSYVLPFLLGDQLVARVDLKNDRTARQLRVLGAWGEERIDREATVTALATELRAWAAWLELDGVTVAERGDLGGELGRVIER